MKTSVATRRCTPNDEVTLALIGQACFLEAFAGILSGADVVAHCQHQHSPEKYRAWLSDPESRLWLAEIEPGAAPIGYLVLTPASLPLDDISAHDLEIKRVYVLHRFQGRGIGNRLMAEAQRAAEAAGARRLLLGVYSQNNHAVSFYEKLGYRRVGERAFNVGQNTYRDFIFALSLTAGS